MADRVVKVTLTAIASQYIAEFKKAQQQTKQTTDDATQRLAKQKQAMQEVGVAALAMGTVAAAGLAYIVKTTADFDAQMSQVKTLAHATAAEMDQLRDAALNMGQGIGFSASQVADAETELVKAGVSVKDQLGGALVGTLDLAAAGQMDVADATQIAAAAMTQFKLSGKDVPHIADLLAAGADKALGSVADLGQGLKYVGPVAQSMGVSIDQTVGTLALFAQNGILADQAGTGLRGVLQSLTSPSAQASGVMKQFGINVYDAQGKFIGLDGVAQQLHDHLGSLDQATRNQALGQIFGNQQITQATVLMQGGAKQVDKWTKAVNDQGFAAEQAAGKMDNLNGDASKLGAAFESSIIKSGSGANDVLRTMTQHLTGLVTGIGSLPEPVLGAGTAVLALVAGVGLLGGGFITLVPKIQATRAAMAELNLTGGGVAKIFGKGGAILLGITALTSAFAGLGAQSELSADQVSQVDAVVGNLSKAKLNDLFKNAGTAIVDATSKSDKFKESLNAVASGNFFQNEAAPTKFIDGITFGLTHLSDVYKTNEAQFRQMGTALSNLAKTDLPTATDKFAAMVKAAGGGKEAIRQLLTEMPDYKAALTDLASEHGKTLTQQELFNLAVGKGQLAEDLAKNSTAENTRTLSQLSGQAQSASGDVDSLSDALNNLGKGALDVSGAQIQLQQSIADATQAAKDNGATLDLNTQKGRDNQTALNGIASSAVALASAQNAAGASQDTLTATVQSGRDAFIAAAEQMGLNAQDAANLADQYGLIPANVPTLMTATGFDTSEEAAKRVKAAIDDVPSNKGVSVTVDAYGAFQTLDELNSYLNQLADKEAKVGGSAAGYYGFRQANGGVVDYYAHGGFSENHVAQIAPAGSMRVWAEPETGGEAYIPLAASKRSRSLSIWAATGKRLGVQGFADGGVTYVPGPAGAGSGFDARALAAAIAPYMRGGNTFNITSDNPEDAAMAVARRQQLLGA